MGFGTTTPLPDTAPRRAAEKTFAAFVESGSPRWTPLQKPHHTEGAEQP
jgi:hypothetical protein